MAARREVLEDVGSLKSSRPEAVAVGDRLYFTGKPCKHGHTATRLTRSSECTACRRVARGGDYYRDYRIKHRAANIDRIRAKVKAKYWKDVDASREENRQNYQKHAESRKAKVKKYISENRDAHARYVKAWDERNPGKRRSYVLNRRSKVRGSGGKLSASEIKEIVQRQKGRCAACREKAKLAMGHIIPLSKGGSGHRRNFQGLCISCNSRKSNKHPVDFNRSLGLLL